MTDRLCKISLFSAILATVAGMPTVTNADSRGKAGYAEAYNQVLAVAQQQEYVDSQTTTVQTASATVTLPVEVEDSRLAEAIKNNTSDSVTVSDLERCSMINIRGVFKWGVPQSGMSQNFKQQCMAVVDLIDATTQEVIATTTLGAGDTMKCNIDMFPESGYSPTISEVVLPADEPPTEKDVEKALNKEQKKNAGFKIAAAAIIGGLAGNALAPKPSGDSKLLGTSKTQILDTAIGAMTAGGVMAASSYSGKVAGETIKSTAVNAAAGMLVGNMAAGMSNSNSVLATTKCDIPKADGKGTETKDCVIGYFNQIDKKDIISSDGKGGDTAYYTDQSGTVIYECTKTKTETKCNPFNFALERIKLLNKENKPVSLPTKAADFEDKFNVFWLDDSSKIVQEHPGTENPTPYYKIASAKRVTKQKMAYAVFDKIKSKTFGYKVSDFEKLVKSNGEVKYYLRYNNSSTAGERLDVTDDTGKGTQEKIKRVLTADEFTFKPSARNSSDGSIIDLSNEARAKATMLGAAAGGALGGFTGYQGAQSEIADRWVTAMNEYTDSLGNFACVSGGYFLAYYNGYATVPPMRDEAEEEEE